ncbi:MAG: hypothetical protein FJX29_03415, partial [Alphaproteobacteria bacterium]|nr:hypothetical protein [Alphaproteobacteria bacterium]
MALDLRSVQAGYLFSEQAGGSQKNSQTAVQTSVQADLQDSLQDSAPQMAGASCPADGPRPRGSASLRRRINDLSSLAMPWRWEALASLVKEKFAPAAALPAGTVKSTERTEGFLAKAHHVSPSALVHHARKGQFLRFVLGRPCWFQQSALQTRVLFRDAQIETDKLPDAVWPVSFDTDFANIVRACAHAAIAAGAPFCPDEHGVAIFVQAHKAGLAHSLALYDAEGHLAGGLYGVECGYGIVTLAVFGRSDEIKGAALAAMTQQLTRKRFRLHSVSPYAKAGGAALRHCGFRPMPRQDFTAACGLLHLDRPHGYGPGANWALPAQDTART